MILLTLHLVVNWTVFTIHICCFISKIWFQMSIFTCWKIFLNFKGSDGVQSQPERHAFNHYAEVAIFVFKITAVRHLAFLKSQNFNCRRGWNRCHRAKFLLLFSWTTVWLGWSLLSSIGLFDVEGERCECVRCRRLRVITARIWFIHKRPSSCESAETSAGCTACNTHQRNWQTSIKWTRS